MVYCPECNVELSKENKCEKCGHQYENDTELTSGVIYMRCSCSIGGEGNPKYPKDLD